MGRVTALPCGDNSVACKGTEDWPGKWQEKQGNERFNVTESPRLAVGRRIAVQSQYQRDRWWELLAGCTFCALTQLLTVSVQADYKHWLGRWWMLADTSNISRSFHMYNHADEFVEWYGTLRPSATPGVLRKCLQLSGCMFD
nr:hypothetical protein L203_01749 [Cryptococcus depauperatus CBS 7841]